MAELLAENRLKMDFISIEFALFFTCVVGVCFLLPLSMRAAWLLISSLFFYTSFEPWFILNLIGAAVVTFFGAFFIQKTDNKDHKQARFIIILALLLSNFLTLRYLPYLSENFHSILRSYDVELRISMQPGIPVGLSFYTFLLIGYLIDILRGIPAERSFGRFFLFVSFFPKIVAGPIERTNNFLVQIRKMPSFDYPLAVIGLQLILLGLFKKVIIADRLAPLVQNIYGNPYIADGPMLTAATITYAFQLYFDFSGYSDIAIGCAAILGFRLIGNFRQPYFATSVSDFWKRWHISLTSWLTEYVYNPIVRQRRFKIKLYFTILIAIFMTFLISGIWHGAHWTFVLWGMLHGSYIIFSVLTQKWRATFVRKSGLQGLVALHKCIKILVTFLLVCFAYILFRAANVADAIYIITHLFTGWSNPVASLNDFVGGAKLSLLIGLSGVFIIMLGEVFEERGSSVRVAFYRLPIYMRWSTYALVALAVLVVGSGNDNQTFIYFRF